MARSAHRATLAVALLALSCGGEGPEIVTFSADALVVLPGGATTLRYSVTSAELVGIQTSDGTYLLTPTPKLFGSVATLALTEDTTYELTATRGSESAKRTVTVTVAKGRARITSLGATPSPAEGGRPVTVAWTTIDAASGRLIGPSGTLYTIPAESLASGSYVVARVSRPTTFILSVTGADGQEVTSDVSVGYLGPTIDRFATMPPRIRRGESAMLSWQTTNAVTATIAGNLTGALPTGRAASGSIQVAPRFTETFTLICADGAGRTATATVGLEVRAPTGAEILSFTATPSAIEPGDAVTLAWEVANAPEGIEISEAGGVLTATTAARGRFVVHPTTATVYRLRALNRAEGNDAYSVAVTVQLRPPSIDTFEATPNPAGAGGSVRLSWTTAGGDSVRVLRGQAQIFSSTTEVARGTLALQAGAIEEIYSLDVTGPGGTTRGMLALRVQARPQITLFDVRPRALVGAGDVTIQWNVSNVRNLQLLANGQPAPGFVPITNLDHTTSSTGTLALTVASTTLFELLAESAGGRVSTSARVSVSAVEVEPNENAATAIPLAGDGSGASGAIDPAGDVDWYSVTVPPGSSVYADTSNGTGGCDTDTAMDLFAADGTTLVASDDDSGLPLATELGGCARIDWRARAAARHLPGGTYYLRVRESAGTGRGPYLLVVSVDVAGCGNGYLETDAGVAEQCDDGNTTSGDGCSSTCRIEPLQTIAGPNTSRVLVGSFLSRFQIDYYELDLQAPGYIRAETYAPSAPQCAEADTVLTLLDQSFSPVGEDDESGVLSCAAIDPHLHPFAAVGAGTYYLAVRSYSGAVIPAYELDLDLVAVGCGNGFVEAGEQCDDANLTSGDGCDAQCQLEGLRESEGQGNNDPTAAGVLGTSEDAVFSGTLTAGDQDWYAVTVPEGEHLNAWLTTSDLEHCPADPTPHVRLALFAPNGATALAVDSTGGPSSTCGRISPATTAAAAGMAAGTYYLRVDTPQSSDALPSYYLHVALLPPGCGNGVKEGTEACDDGDTTSGDGCDATCHLEVSSAVLHAPGGTVVVTFPAPGASATVRFDVARAGTSIGAVAADPGGTACTGVDTSLELLDGSFSRLGLATLGGPHGSAGECAAILYPEDEYAVDLAAGSYYLTVRDQSAIAGSASLTVTYHEPACGDGVLTLGSGEQCDDGDLVSGDHCSARCVVEPIATYSSTTGRERSFFGALRPRGDRPPYRVVVTGGAVRLHAEVYTPDRASGCGVGEPVVRLYDASFALLASNAQAAIDDCARLDFEDTRLAPGIYFVTIGQHHDDGEIPAYQLVLETRAADVCGNGVIEPPETCDDDNTSGGDGCSAGCQLEGAPAVTEVEPNDTVSTSQSLGTLARPATIDVAAHVRRGADEDWYRFVVPTGGANGVFTTYGQPGDLTSCEVDTLMWLYDGVPSDLTVRAPGSAEPALVAYDDNGGFGGCAALGGTSAHPGPVTLHAGTYYLRVRGVSPFSTRSYFLRLRSS